MLDFFCPQLFSLIQKNEKFKEILVKYKETVE